MRLLPVLFLSIFTLTVINSCGGDGGGGGYGGGGGGGSEEEESTGGASGGGTGGTTGGTGGTSGGTSGGSEQACVSNQNRTNMTGVLMRMVALGSINGTYVGQEILDDGPSETFNGSGSYTIAQESQNSWQVSGGFCDPDICMETAVLMEFRGDGCFYANDKRARIVSTTANQFTFSFTNDVDNREQTRFSVSSDGKLRSLEQIFEGNEKISEFVFEPL